MIIGGVALHQLDPDHANTVMPVTIDVSARKRHVACPMEVEYDSVQLEANTLKYKITSGAVQAQVALSIEIGVQCFIPLIGLNRSVGTEKISDDEATTEENENTVIKVATVFSLANSGFSNMDGTIDKGSNKLKINDNDNNNGKFGAAPVNVTRGVARTYYGAIVNGDGSGEDKWNQTGGDDLFEYNMSVEDMAAANEILTWNTSGTSTDSDELYDTDELATAVSNFKQGTTMH